MYVGVLCCVVGLVYALVVYLFFSSAFDFLFRERVGCNVVGEVKPAGPVTRQVVLVAHHDAPYVFSFLEHTESLANIRFILASVGFTWILGYGACLGVRFALGHPHVPDGVWLWITVGCLVAAFQLWFMITSTPSPGAGDNLNSSFMALTLARYFVWHRNHGHPLEQTRLVLLSTGAEECGERGAKAYLRAHGDELRATPSYVINLDTVVHPDDLAVLTRDRNSTVGLSSAMVADVCAVANWLGIAITAKPFRLGAGATDAWPFAKVARGVTGIVGSSLAIVARGHTYHTSRDLVGAINAAAVRDALMISAAYIRMVDAQPA